MIDLATVPLGHGLGTENRPCTIAAINLARSGVLTDEDPDECMSGVVRRWVIGVQDSMPETMLEPDDEHGIRWRRVAPLIAGSRTSDPSDDERLAMLMDWMWDRLGWRWQEWVPEAAHDAWERMLSERTGNSALVASGAVNRCADILADRCVGNATWTAFSAVQYRDNYSDEIAEPFSDFYANVYSYVAEASGLVDEFWRDEFWRDADPATLLIRLVETKGTS